MHPPPLTSHYFSQWQQSQRTSTSERWFLFKTNHCVCGVNGKMPRKESREKCWRRSKKAFGPDRELLCDYFIIKVWIVLAFCLDINSIWKLYTKSRLILTLLYNFSSWYWKILYLYIYLYIYNIYIYKPKCIFCFSSCPYTHCTIHK